MRRFFIINFLCLCTLCFSQSKSDFPLIGKFTYLLTSKPNKLYPTNIYKEQFSLQVTNDRSFYISEVLLKRDSVLLQELKDLKFNNAGTTYIDFRGKNIPITSSRFLVVQNHDGINLYANVKMVKLSYHEERMSNWKLLDETKTINTLVCKKAEMRYKGRDWVAWYAPSIPFPYGPHKFGGLPGLIVKVTDRLGDYDYELVHAASSKSLEGQFVTIDKRHYENAKLVSVKDFKKARLEEMSNIIYNLESMGTVITPEHRKILREREIRNEEEKKGYNPMELEE